MKNTWMKKVLVLMMCGALAVPAAGMAQPMVAQATGPATGGAAVTPVSYTHLDVYKRQGIQ